MLTIGLKIGLKQSIYIYIYDATSIRIFIKLFNLILNSSDERHYHNLKYLKSKYAMNCTRDQTEMVYYNSQK